MLATSASGHKTPRWSRSSQRALSGHLAPRDRRPEPPTTLHFVDPEAERDQVRAPLPLLVAAAVVALEGLGFVVFGAFEAINTTSSRVVMGSTTALFFV